MSRLFVAAVSVLACFAGPHSADAGGFSYPSRGGNQSWTGFYAGGAVGAVFGSTGIDLDIAALVQANLGNVSAQDVTLSGYLGYNYQLGTWVLGVEGGANWLNTRFATEFPGVSADPFLRSDWQFTVSGRAGYLMTPSALLYAKVGWALTEAQIQTGTLGMDTTSSYRNGLLVGGGIETLISSNWLVRVEGEYALGSQSARVGSNFYGYAAAFSPDFLTARIGLGYKF